jgi:hypothetical protein
MRQSWAVYFVAAQFLFSFTAAQIPSVWKPFDVITFFCARWYHQGRSYFAAKTNGPLTYIAVVKNDVLYLYGGIETFNVPNITVKSQNNTLGYSKCCD